ncbi:hypothetical protein D6T64_12050 [Cryobacterium melibiosiphilum]|uniref:Uncharacterized protein n=1 Tax=Cryobacterium melibiosiphilum TaxID=995039 RepID=A0A3A5MRZ8_9MICO|nr:hypothetical protein [Cryobacterium melibiosiphilum]RJT88114.1 hypothetical protein D6T64_12050 [Cryobacterium melibiosiphilum]
MARIKILELPMLHVGDASKTPFSIIIDEVEQEDITGYANNVVRRTSELTQEEADKIARDMGAVSAILAACTLDIA